MIAKIGETYRLNSAGTAWERHGRPSLPTSSDAPMARPAQSSTMAYYENLSGSTLPARCDTAGSSKAVSFDEGTFEFADFATGANNYGWYSGIIQGIYGRGPNYTTFQVAPSTSTQGHRVPASNPPASNGLQNPLYAMRLGNQFNPAPTLKGFKVRCTPQGHQYHGFHCYRWTGGLVEDVKFEWFKGDLGREPGEIFAISTYLSSNITYRRVEVDGRNSAGVAVGGSGFAANNGTGMYYEDCYSHHQAEAHGWAMWETESPEFLRCRAISNQRGFNFENVTGTVEIRDCTMQGNSVSHIFISSNHDSAVYNIHDPVFDGAKLNVRVTGYAGLPRTQNPNDVHLYVGGVLRNDLMTLTVQN